MRRSQLVNISDEDRRRRSTGSSLYRGQCEASEYLSNIYDEGLDIVKGSLEQTTLVMRTATSEIRTSQYLI